MMISDIEDYFAKGCGRCDRFDTDKCSAKVWARGLSALRDICLSSQLTEMVKWGHPCYTHAGRNIVIIGAFRDDFRLSFFNAGLMKDPKRVLQKQGPNTQHPDMLRFIDNAGPDEMRKIIRHYLDEAKGYAARGLTAPNTTKDLELLGEMAAAFDADPDLADAFRALTPGRQKSYVIHLNGAKTSATRVKRLQKARDNILRGKGFHER